MTGGPSFHATRTPLTFAAALRGARWQYALGASSYWRVVLAAAPGRDQGFSTPWLRVEDPAKSLTSHKSVDVARVARYIAEHIGMEPSDDAAGLLVRAHLPIAPDPVLRVVTARGERVGRL